MFCDLVGSTALSEQLDPEEYREVVRAYQQTSAAVIERFGGHIAQYLGDGLLIYFGYPQAHEDDAARAVRAGLGIISALPRLNEQTQPSVGARRRRAPTDTATLQVRIGIHTGPVVISEIGSAERHEQLALGDTPNIAARVQGQATPNTIAISATTHQLVQGLFECQELGARPLKGISTPLTLYQAVREEAAHSRFEVAVRRGLTPLVGREHEVGLLTERWERAKQAEGQVVLLGGEPGIGKSRLVQVIREQAERDAARRLEFRCSPYHQNSAFYPILEHLHRLLQFTPNDSAAERLGKLEQALTSYRFPQADTVPLLAALLSLPHPEKYPALNFSPQRQKQKTQEVLVAWLVEEAERHALYCPWEDVHWADPSTLELLTLLVDQVPTARLCLLLTFRPEFVPPWGTRSHLSHLTLSRLGRSQVTQMIERVAGDRILPAEMLQQIVAKTDGVPLFVEELTKAVVESVESIESVGSVESRGNLSRSAVSLGIPVTLQDALMARLDRLGAAKEAAQLGATLGREFSYELLQAISPVDEEALQRGLSHLVDAELIHQRGMPPHRQYIFKHALIQDAAYQSLLKSRRQQLHQQIAQVLEERFAEIKGTQPELVAHHYTEAGLMAQAIPYWHQAGQRSVERSANVEAISHLTKALKVLNTLPDTPERAQQELTLQIALGVPLMATKGFGAPEAGTVYRRARELCQHVGETLQLFPVLWGLWAFYVVRAEYQTGRELGEQCLRLAQNVQDPALLAEAHYALGTTLANLGEGPRAREHFEQVVTLYDPHQHRSLAFLYGGLDPGVLGRAYAAAWCLWFLGYPEQALVQSREAITLAQGLAHPFSLVWALLLAAHLHQLRREGPLAQEHAEAAIRLASEQGFMHELAGGTMMQGSALAEQGQNEEGITQMCQGLDAHRATGAKIADPYHLALLAEAYGKVGQPEEGLRVLAEALAAVDKTGERVYEAELYRLRGELTLQKEFKVQGSKFQVTAPRPPTPDPQAEAEARFLKAIEIARRQQAKSLELRAVMSLARLRQQQATQSASRNTQHEARLRLAEAHTMLSEIYGWFTEGFDTKDLQEAKALLAEFADPSLLLSSREQGTEDP
jgi:class 3 adenylate cyclase/predicted ATPase